MTEVRDFRTDRVNRARLQLEITRAARSGIIVVASLVIGALITLWVARNIGSTIGESSQTVSFAVSDANDVVAQSDEVRFLGIPAGRVGGIKMDGTQPVITASFLTRYGHIYRNARAIIRPNTALEDMYLDVTYPGTPSAGLATANDPLPVTATDTSVNIDDVLDTFNADARVSLRTLLNNLGNGLANRGASLQEAFVETVPFLQEAGRLSHELADRTTMIRQLVHNTSTLMGDLSQRQQELRTLVSSGSKALTTLEKGSGNLNATLQELPGTVDDVDTSFVAVSGVLGRVDTALRSLDPVADDLPTSLAAVRSLTADASPAIAALQSPVQQLVPLVQTLSPLAGSLSKTVAALTPQERAFIRAVEDLVSCKTGVQGFFEWNPSLAKYGDERGNSPRGNVAIGVQSSGVLDSPFEYAPQACTTGTAVGGRPTTSADEH
jgi:virulence factor Mce-like protein